MGHINKLVENFYEINEKLENRPILIAVRRGLINVIPLLLVGSIALIFSSLPIPVYQAFMKNFLGVQWKNIFIYIRDSTFNIFSLLSVVCISYSYASEFSGRYSHNVSTIIVSLVSLCSFIAISGINITNFGVIGVFIAIIVAITSSLLFLKLSSVKFLQIKVFTEGADSTFNYALTAIYPAAITIAVFAILNQILTVIFGISDIQSFISQFLNKMFTRINSPFWSSFLFVTLTHIFWFLGMHGANILEPAAQHIFPDNSLYQAAIDLGQAPTVIFTKTFFNAFILMGGCGATLCLIGAIAIAGKHKNQLQLAKLSFLPVLFNINELLIFGIPIVLNPVYIIPFLGTPLIMTVSSYLAMSYNLAPLTRNLVEWTTPVFLSGYIATNSINGCLLQLFNICLGILCYIPFVRLAENVAEARLEKNLEKVYVAFKQNEGRGTASTLLTRYDDIGSIARFLTADLEHDLQNNQVTMFYQPQVDYAGNVFGVESLLRWKHDNYGYIYPPLTIALAEEAQLIDKLGYHIVDTACSDLARMNNLGFRNITLSVNISAVQLENAHFIEVLEEIIKKHQIKPQTLKVEITEQIALASSAKIIKQIMSLKNLGVKLAMDDFGMGHSSLMYLKEYDFDTIKLDGSLVREILSNTNCRNIISTILSLGKSLNYSVIAEYVEEKEQRRVLHELGCDKYQGYLYSKAIPFNELVEYIAKCSKPHPAWLVRACD
jgi:lactose/cellobiose-specific phosphotransferase system IIC component